MAPPLIKWSVTHRSFGFTAGFGSKPLRELDVGGRNGAQIFSAPLLAFGLREI